MLVNKWELQQLPPNLRLIRQWRQSYHRDRLLITWKQWFWQLINRKRKTYYHLPRIRMPKIEVMVPHRQIFAYSALARKNVWLVFPAAIWLLACLADIVFAYVLYAVVKLKLSFVSLRKLQSNGRNR